MQDTEESLFSLELVVEKLYLPHITCRFPAIAFRLLDFPTLLISHVESDLSNTIKTKIFRGHFYNLPKQFNELKDKHGNFLMKKGKSCLFKIPLNIFKMHLTNTPLYVMIIDEFPDPPKLLGNSTVPLNSLMDEICVDITKLGTTMPSVHGDKGLFKIYSLMGKEIGYFVFGYRLLCLGSAMVPHLQDVTLTKYKVRQTDKECKIEQNSVNQSKVESIQFEVPSKDTCDRGSMTEVVKQDVILQTEFNAKAVNAAVSAPEIKKEKPNAMTASSHTQRMMKQILNENQRVTENIENEGANDEIITNIVCPPALFYNSKCDPKIRLQKVLPLNFSTSEDELTIEDLEGTDHRTNNKEEIERKLLYSKQLESTESVHYFQKPNQSDKHRKKQNAVSCEQADNVFPVLTALLNELTGIKSCQFLETVAKMKHRKQSKFEVPVTLHKPPTPRLASKLLEELSQSRHPLKKVDQTQKGDVRTLKEDKETLGGQRNFFFQSLQHSPRISRDKGWLRQVPQHGVKKSSLTFGLTHTQRLRLAKANPRWLKLIEKEQADLKKKKEQRKAVSVDLDVDLNETKLDDTLTEVRRLAQRELEKTDQELDTTARTTAEQHDLIKSHDRRRVKQNSSRGKKWLHRNKKQPESPKHQGKSLKHSETEMQRSFEEMNHKALPVRRKAEDMVKFIASTEPDETSQRSDQQSPKSIEVHLPSAQVDEDDQSDKTLSDKDIIPEDNREGFDKKFPGFGTADATFPESIDGQYKSLNETKLSDQPLESTRLSTNERISKIRGSSDFDTQQFMSTDEPELQDLISNDESRSDNIHSGRYGHLSAAVASSVHRFSVVNPVASDQSPVPATRSTMKDPRSGRELTQQPDTPHSQCISKQPTPRPRWPVRVGKESINTDSVSSYQPSDVDNALVSLSSDANYSDDFHPVGSELDESLTDISSPGINHPKVIPPTKLGYTIS